MIRPKKCKFLIGVIAALVLVLAMSMTALAENGEKEEIPFTVETKTAGHTITLFWTPVEGIDLYRVYDEFGNELTKEPLLAPDFTDAEAVIEPFAYVIQDVECSTIQYKYVVKGFVLDAVESDKTEDTETPVEPEVPGDTETPVEPENPADSTTEVEPESPADSEVVVSETPAQSKGAETSDVDATDVVVENEGMLDSGDNKDDSSMAETVEREVYAAEASAIVWIDMKMPVISSCKFIDADSVSVSWTSSTNICEYNVYRKVGNGAWKYIATVTSNTYVDNDVKLGTDYTYKVRGVSKCCYNLSDYNAAGQKASYVKATTITSAYAPNSSEVKVTWNAVSGANGYYVYAQIDNGGYKKLTTTTATSYTYKLSSSYWGKNISFKVYPYCAEYTSPASNVKSTVFQPVQPTLKSAKANTAKKNTVTWSKVSGVKGYKVYRKTPGGEWKCIKTIADASATSYADTSVVIGTTYVYTVAGYWQTGSKVETGYYNANGLTVKPAVTIKYKEVTDKKSIMYGKTLKLFYDMDGNQIQNTEQFVNDPSAYYLYVNKTNQYITAYVIEDGYYVPVRAIICSTGKTLSSTPNGTFKTKAKYKLHELNGPVWGWYCTRIVDHILFHSVPYKYDEDDLTDNKRLNVGYYNKLGSRASQGCVRLTTGDAYWIYNNCKLGTTVKIYESSGYEPLKKPTSYKLEKSHNWDPTSPFANYKCKEKGCHDVD